MKVYIPSYKRADVMTTPSLIREMGWEPVVLLHDVHEVVDYVQKQREVFTVINTLTPDGNKFDQIKAFLKDKHIGEWFIFAEDDINAFSLVKLGYIDKMPLKQLGKPNKEHYIKKAQYVPVPFMESLEKAEKDGCVMLGLCNVDNVMFRANYPRWSYNRIANGGMFAVKNGEWVQEVTCGLWDDVEVSLIAMSKGYKILIDNSIKVEHERYMKGGFSVGPERTIREEQVFRELLQRYPGAFTYSKANVGWSLRLNKSWIKEHVDGS